MLKHLDPRAIAALTVATLFAAVLAVLYLALSAGSTTWGF